MNNRLIEKQDPRITDFFRRIVKVDKLLDKLDSVTQCTFKEQRFVTDNELSRILKISRRTLQEYRTAGVFPYYLICGKILYKESEIQRLLDKSRRQCLDEIQLF